MGEEEIMLGLDQGPNEPDFECTVLDVLARQPGFYVACWRTYYVARSGGVYLVRAPGQRVMLQETDDLPPDAEPAAAESRDVALQHVAAAVEAVAGPHARSERRSRPPAADAQLAAPRSNMTGSTSPPPPDPADRP